LESENEDHVQVPVIMGFGGEWVHRAKPSTNSTQSIVEGDLKEGCKSLVSHPISTA